MIIKHILQINKKKSFLYLVQKKKKTRNGFYIISCIRNAFV